MKTNLINNLINRSCRLLSVFFVIILLSRLSFLNAQNLQWAYSFKNQLVLENIDAISTNQTNRFAIIGSGNQGINMDPINALKDYNSPGNFIAVYNENANIQWLKPTVGIAFCVKVVLDGSVFIAGIFSQSQDFDPSLDKSLILNASNGFSYLQKFNPDGTLAWVCQSAIDGIPSEIEALNDGRIIVAGRSDVNSTITLNNTKTVSLDKGVFILEVSPSGTLSNAYGISVPAQASYMYVYDIATDASNNIYLSGSLDGIADFDISNATNQNSATNAYDAYLVKYNSNFELQWFKKFGDSSRPTGWDKATGIAIDKNLNIYLAGIFTSITDFDPSNPSKFVLTSSTNSTVPSSFIAKYSPDGTLNWVKKIGNTNDGIAKNYASVSTINLRMQNNQLYIALEGEGNWDIDPSAAESVLSVGGIAMPGIGFAKYTNEGTLIGGFSIDTVLVGSGITAIGFDMLGENSFVTAGVFTKLIDFNPLAEKLVLATDPKGMFYNFDKDLYIAKYSIGNTLNIDNKSNESISFIGMYPNPCQDILNFKIQPNTKIIKVQLYDSMGRLEVFDIDNNQSINVKHLQKGVYYVQLMFSDNSFASMKLIK
ncbi:MAG: T9SS C-terminal target domain-containing protein [Cytophagales bacterium]|nr:MAG: T9SS C-terminal target domain-containing protein [Cytophagales bacterium]